MHIFDHDQILRRFKHVRLYVRIMSIAKIILAAKMKLLTLRLAKALEVLVGRLVLKIAEIG